MLYWKIEQKKLNLRYNWKLSRNESSYKINFFITVTENDYSGIGEVAPNIRYLETTEKIESEFELFRLNPMKEINSVEQINKFLDTMQISNSLRFGIESAAIHLLCAKKHCSIFELLKIPFKRSFPISYTVPVMNPERIKEFFEENKLSRFGILKVKVNEFDGFECLKELTNITNQPLIIDANEAWKDVDDFLYFEKNLKNFNIEFIEQPFPVSFIEEYKYLKANSSYLIFADESITSSPDWHSLKEQFHGVNIKLMKSGGYINGFNSIITAKKLKLKTMIGCMVETSIGILSAAAFSGLVDYRDLDGFLIIDDEPFKMVSEKNGELMINKLNI